MEMEVTSTFMSSSMLSFFNFLTESESEGACAIARFEETTRLSIVSAVENSRWQRPIGPFMPCKIRIYLFESIGGLHKQSKPEFAPLRFKGHFGPENDDFRHQQWTITIINPEL